MTRVMTMQQPTGRPPLSRDKQRWAFAILLRREDCLVQASEVITADLFSPAEKWLYLAWRLALQYHQEFQTLPSKQLMLDLVNDHLEHNPAAINAGDEIPLDEFLSFAFGLRDEELNERAAMFWLRQFLEDRWSDKVRADFATGQTPVDLRAKFDSLKTVADDLSGLSGQELPSAFPSTWMDDSASVHVYSTGLSFLDAYMKPNDDPTTPGGHAPQETYGILGPYGGGKTTMAVQLTVETALLSYLAYERARAAGQAIPIGLSFHFSYEASLTELRERALSYMAQIPRDRINKMIREADLELLHGPGIAALPYEQVLFAGQTNSGAPFPCERDRYDYAIRVLDRHWVPVDMTGSGDDPSRGAGLTPETAVLIRQKIRSCERRVGEPHECRLALVDYVLAAIERHITHRGLDHSQLRHFVNKFGLRFKYDVAVPFNCPVWCMHQLGTKAQSYRPNKKLNRTDAAEGRAFVENLDYCFGISIGDGEGYTRFEALKHRRGPSRPHLVLRLNGAMARFVDVTDSMIIDETSGKATPRNSRQTAMVDGGDAGPHPGGGSRPEPAGPRSAAQSVRNTAMFTGN